MDPLENVRVDHDSTFVLMIPDLVPPTLVARDLARLRAFIDAQGGDGVVKPLDGCGGQGVLRVRRGDPNLSSLLEIATNGGRIPVVAQAYLPAVREGDKRIILLGGEPLGAVLRIPREGELRRTSLRAAAPRRPPSLPAIARSAGPWAPH